MIVDAVLLDTIRQQYKMPLDGIHGLSHWTRVWKIGVLLAPMNGANTKVVEAFAWIHDACRQSEKTDRHHGLRAARLAKKLNSEFLGLNEEEMELLDRACRYHDRGMITKEPTIGTCWDADRLDLWRIDCCPEKSYLSTEAAQDDSIIRLARRLSEEVHHVQ